VKLPEGIALPHAFLYGEDQSRYLVVTDDGGALLAAARAAGVPAVQLGYSADRTSPSRPAGDAAQRTAGGPRSLASHLHEQRR